MKSLLITFSVLFAVINSPMAFSCDSMKSSCNIDSDAFGCKFIVKSNLMNNVMEQWLIDGTSESVLIEQGKEVTRDENQAHFKIFITHDFKYSDPVFGSFKYDKTLTLEIQRNDGVIVYSKSINGDNSVRNKKRLLEKLSDINFKCTKD